MLFRLRQEAPQDLIPKRDASNWAGTWKWSDQRLRWSQPVSWAWLDLNQRPHPYQQSRAYRYATRHFCRSCATVRGEVMRCSKGWAEGRLRSDRRCSRRGSRYSRNQTVLTLKMSPDLHRTTFSLAYPAPHPTSSTTSGSTCSWSANKPHSHNGCRSPSRATLDPNLFRGQHGGLHAGGLGDAADAGRGLLDVVQGEMWRLPEERQLGPRAAQPATSQPVRVGGTHAPSVEPAGRTRPECGGTGRPPVLPAAPRPAPADTHVARPLRQWKEERQRQPPTGP